MHHNRAATSQRSRVKQGTRTPWAQTEHQHDCAGAQANQHQPTVNFSTSLGYTSDCRRECGTPKVPQWDRVVLAVSISLNHSRASRAALILEEALSTWLGAVGPLRMARSVRTRTTALASLPRTSTYHPKELGWGVMG
jgi:hypothetical protein